MSTIWMLYCTHRREYFCGMGPLDVLRFTPHRGKARTYQSERYASVARDILPAEEKKSIIALEVDRLSIQQGGVG